MNDREILALVAKMSAAWPAVDIPDNTVDVWAEQLANIDANDALETASLLIRTSKWFPSVSEFLDASRNFTRRRLENVQPAGELGSGETLTPDEQKANVRRIIQQAKDLAAEHRGRYRKTLRPQ